MRPLLARRAGALQLQPGANLTWGNLFYYGDTSSDALRTAPTTGFTNNFKIKERLVLQMRLDVLNVQNHSQMAAPDMNLLDATFGKMQSQSASVNRFYDIEGRIQF